MSWERNKVISETIKNWVTTLSLILGIIYTTYKVNDLINAKIDLQKEEQKVELEKKKKIEAQKNAQILRTKAEKTNYINQLTNQAKSVTKEIKQTKAMIEESKKNNYDEKWMSELNNILSTQQKELDYYQHELQSTIKKN